MSTSGALAGLQTFEKLNIDYEEAYHDNPFKIACIEKAISLLPSSRPRRVLDVGCGTGMPVSEMLSKTGLDLVGFDISPKMIEFAQSRVKGSFTVSDMLTYQPSGKFAGIFIIFCQLQLSYADMHAAVYKFAQALEAGGILALGQMPGDSHVKDASRWDETKTYVEDYPAPFMGDMPPTLMLSAQGQREFLTSMGMEIVSETIDMFQPKNDKCLPEQQQYIIVRRTSEQALREPKPLPKTEKI